MSSLFLSCTHEDLDKALDLKKEIKYKIDFYNKDINVSVDSEEADSVKKEIFQKILKSTATVCLIGENTFKNQWVNWELVKSVQTGKKIIAMALKGIEKAALPKLIKESNLDFYAWDPESIDSLLE